MEFKDLSLKQIIATIKSGKASQKEVYDYFLDRIKEFDGDLQAFNLIHPDFVEKDPKSVLSGVPIGVKDVFCET